MEKDPEFQDASDKDPAGNGDYVPSDTTRLMDLRPELDIGPEDRRFRLVRELGGGAMGRVWLARDLAEESPQGGECYKALKVITPHVQDVPSALARLKKEARYAARLNHPHIVNVFDWRQGQDGWLFVLMEYLQGETLGELLVREGDPGLPWKRVKELLEPMAAALDYAHGQGIIHRDLKPDNVLITGQGQVKLLDFGLADRLRETATQLDNLQPGPAGTLTYMPPDTLPGGHGQHHPRPLYLIPG